MRCFIALILPESARRSLARAAAAYREGLSTSFVTLGEGRTRPRISWARDEGYHLTLAFLGEIEGTAIEVAAASLDAAAGFGDISCGFAGLGGFPQGGSWRVLFAMLEDGGRSVVLHRLVNEALAEGAQRAGLPPLNAEWPRGRPFVPHVTLARAKAGRGLPACLAAGPWGTELAGAWTIGRCALYKSELQRSGAVYTELRGVDLSGT
jgi:2'-5' RNA ligase